MVWLWIQKVPAIGNVLGIEFGGPMTIAHGYDERTL